MPAADCCRLRCLVRQPECLSSRVLVGAEVVPDDVFDAASLSLLSLGLRRRLYDGCRDAGRS